MPNLKSSKARVKTNERDTLRNKATKSVMRTSLKKLDNALNQGELDSIEPLVRQTEKTLDKAAQKGVIHKNKASRTKSRLRKRIQKAQKA